MSKNYDIISENLSGIEQTHRSYGTKNLSVADNKNENKRPRDLLEATIGNYGLWQFKISLLMSLLKFPIAWFQLGIVFLAPHTEFWCKAPLQYNYMTDEQWKMFIKPNNFSINQHYSPAESGSCMMEDVESVGNYSIVPCQWGYEYNRSIIRSSIITEWDLVCGRERLVDLAQIILMFGVLVGSLVFGLAADKFGRRNILMFSIIFQSLCGILSALTPWLSLFMLSRFLLAMANGGTMITSFVMCMEIVGGKWRAIVPILYQIPFGLGNTIMASIAYFLRDWRKLQFTLSGLSAIYVSYIFLVPESPRWLLAVGRKEEAISILEKAAEVNGGDKSGVSKAVNEISLHQVVSCRKGGLFELISTCEMRKRTILLCLNWFICGVSFFGFSQYLGQISDNIYFAVSAGGLIAVPGTLLCVMVVEKNGRRVSIAFASLFTALCFLLILIIPRGMFREDWLKIALAGCGVIGMSVSVPALYLFTGELFPTTLRNAGVGTAVMCSKLGSMLAPLVIALGAIGWYLPLLILGILSTVEAMLVLLLPETLNTNLPETINDVGNADQHAFRSPNESHKSEQNSLLLPSHLKEDDIR